jgi:hypothetical protein
MTNARLRVAELTSGIGALVIGVGLGAWLAAAIGRLSVPIAAFGLVLHGFGMWDKHRLESSTAQPRWVPLLYWVCWVLLAVVAMALAVSQFRG